MKKNVLISFLLLALTVSFSFYSTGCAKKDSIPEPSGGGSGDEGDGDGGGDVEPDPVGGGDSSTLGFFFQVNNADTKYAYYLNQDTAWNTSCNIPASSTSSQSINCYLDVKEGDLHFHGGAIEFGAPAEMCPYIYEAQPWFWNFPVGKGPSQVTMEIDTSGDTPVITSCTARRDNDGATVPCASHIEIKRVDTDTKRPVCVYDHSDADDDLPNCCTGSFQFTVDTDDGTTVSRNVTSEKWGSGSVKECIGGSPQHNGTNFSQAGYPDQLLHDNKTEGGKSIQREIPSNIMTANTRFSFASNFYSTDTNQHSHPGFYNATPVNAPYAYAPIDDLDGSPVTSGQVAHTLLCMDDGHEVKHAISLYIREWDTYSDFVAYDDSDGVVYQPDRRDGVEGVDCDYGGSGGGCNDYWDFDDLLDDAGGSYNTTVPDVDLRNSWFPNYVPSQ